MARTRLNIICIKQDTKLENFLAQEPALNFFFTFSFAKRLERIPIG